MKATSMAKVRSYKIELDQEEMELLWHRLNMNDSAFAREYGEGEGDGDKVRPLDEIGVTTFSVWNELDEALLGRR